MLEHNERGHHLAERVQPRLIFHRTLSSSEYRQQIQRGMVWGTDYTGQVPVYRGHQIYSAASYQSLEHCARCGLNWNIADQ